MIAGVVVLHIWALHVVGQNNPTGIEPKSEQGHGAVHALRDGEGRLRAWSCFCILFAWFVFYMPNYLGHADNYIPANPVVTPTHIVPEWYFLPFYAILRAIPNKLARRHRAVRLDRACCAFLPWLDTSRVRSASYRPLYRQFFWIFVAGLHRARLARLQAAGRRLRDRGAHPHRSTTSSHFLDHPAAARPDRDAAAAAELDLGGRSLRQAMPVGAPAGADGRRADGDDDNRSLVLARRLAARPRRRAGARRAGARRRCRRSRSGRSPGPFGKFDRGAAAARLQGLQGGLRGLPRPEATWRSAISPSRAVPASPRRRSRRSPPSTRSRTARTTRARCSSAPAGRPTISRRRSRTSTPPRARYNGGAARHVGARQGAQLRARLPVVHLRHVHAVSRSTASTTSHALLNGYKDKPPAGVTLPQGAYYNEYFPGHAIAMPPPLTDGQVDYTDGIAGDGRSVRQGRRRVPDVGGRAAPGGAQAHRLPGDDLPARARRACSTSPRRRSGPTCTEHAGEDAS